VAHEGGARREQQDVIVLGADEGVDRHDAVAAGPVLDDDRLVPFFGQPVRQQPGADIGSAARPERQHELDRPCRPGLRRARRGREQRQERRGEHDRASEASGTEHRSSDRTLRRD